MGIRHGALLVVMVLFVLATLRAARASGGRNPLLVMARAAFRVPLRPWLVVGVGLAIGAATVLAPALAAHAGGWLEFVWQPPHVGTFAPFVASLLLIASWAALEEFIFRGVLLPAISASAGTVVGVAATAVLFALPHVGARGGAFEDGMSIALWLLDGLAFGLAAVVSGSIWLPTAWHVGKNVAVWLALDGSTLALTPGLLSVRYVRESWLAGSASRTGGLDVGMVLVLVIALAAVALRAGRTTTSLSHE